jgi:hypothetical protein
VREKSAQDFLDDFLIKRKSEIYRNPALKTKDRITQRGVWYRIRPIMISEGFEPKENWGTTAKYISSKIKERCEKLFRLKREDLGIIASSRATMYYNGSHNPVNIDNFRDLARQGVAIIIIEKEGIADLLYTFADKYGVALVHTQGRFTEDGKDLIEAAKEYGSFVGILVDYDAVGREIPKARCAEAAKVVSMMINLGTGELHILVIPSYRASGASEQADEMRSAFWYSRLRRLR